MFACNHAFEAMLVLACPIKISSKKGWNFKNKIMISFAVHFSLEDMISKKYIYLSKLAAQVVTTTPPENLVWEPYWNSQSEFWFWQTQTLILFTRSIFVWWGEVTKKYME